jgi:CRISPR-associated protein Csm1
MTDKTAVLLGAFFHDIGKFHQRGLDENPLTEHETLSSGFVNGLFADDLINKLVLYHHEEDLCNSNLTGKFRSLAEIVCEADSLASGERKPDRTVTAQQPFESIFSGVNIGGKLGSIHFQPISELSAGGYKFPSSSYTQQELKKQYKENWSQFFAEITNSQSHSPETLMSISKKYLWCIPSSSWHTRSDISLYEHCRITAAIALCAYDSVLEKFPAIENYVEVRKFIKQRDDQRYLLLLADATGIQNYIYNVGHSGAAKALKGRSFFVQQMLDNVAYWLLDEKFNLPLCNLIYSSGGKFYLLLPNTERVRSAILEAKKELEEKFLHEYNGDLGIVMGDIPLSGDDFTFSAINGHPISRKWDELNKITEKLKKQKLSSVWRPELFLTLPTDGNMVVCKNTGVELFKDNELLVNLGIVKLSENIHFNKYELNGKYFYEELFDNGTGTGEYISEEQFRSQKIGLKLRNNNKQVLIGSDPSWNDILGLNSFEIMELRTESDTAVSRATRAFLLDDLNINSVKTHANVGIKFYGGNWRLPQSYSEVIAAGSGIQRLGVLRLDVDNLGQIFKDGFGNRATFSRIVQLSSMLDFFFSCYINTLQKMFWSPETGLTDKYSLNAKYVKELLEIVYSGGDDVFMVGHWCVLPDVALWLNRKFKEFTCNNPAFSFSAGIYLFENKFPMYKAAIEAGNLEHVAKSVLRKNQHISESIKDGICFLDPSVPVSWRDFEHISTLVKSFYSWLEVGKQNNGEVKKISKSFVSRLFTIHAEYLDGKGNRWAKWRWRAAYSLSRYANQHSAFKQEVNAFAAELFTSDKTEQDIVKLLNIIAIWTDLLTRKKEHL